MGDPAALALRVATQAGRLALDRMPVRIGGAVPVELGRRMAGHAIHLGFLPVDVRWEAFVLPGVFGEYSAAVTGPAGVLHRGSLRKEVPIHQAAARRLRLADVAVAAARMAALTGLLEHGLDVRPAVGRDQLEEILVATHGEVQAGLDVRHFLLVAGGAGGIRVSRGARHQSLVRGLLAAGLGIALVARLAAIHGVRAGQERLLHQVALVRFPRRGRRAASPFAFFRGRWIGRGERFQFGRVGVAGDALRGGRIGRGGRTDPAEDKTPTPEARMRTTPTRLCPGAMSALIARWIHEDDSDLGVRPGFPMTPHRVRRMITGAPIQQVMFHSAEMRAFVSNLLSMRSYQEFYG